MLQLFYSSAKLLHFAANLLCRSVGVVLVSTLQVMVIQVVQAIVVSREKLAMLTILLVVILMVLLVLLLVIVPSCRVLVRWMRCSELSTPEPEPG